MAVAGAKVEDGSSRVSGAERGKTESVRICDRALDALALTQARLAWLEGRCTSEQLPAGHWLVISPENLLEKLIELAVQVKAVVQGLRATLREQPAPERGVAVRVPVAAGAESSGARPSSVEQYLLDLGGSIELESDRGLRVTIALARS